MPVFPSRRRIRNLKAQLDTAHQTIKQQKADLATAEYNQSTAIQAREKAEDKARRLSEHNTALEQRVADLQAANETAYSDLAARAGAHGPIEIPRQREDGAA